MVERLKCTEYQTTFIICRPPVPHLCKVANSCMHGTQRRHSGVHVLWLLWAQQAGAPLSQPLSRTASAVEVFKLSPRAVQVLAPRTVSAKTLPAFAKSIVQASPHREVMMHINAPQREKAWRILDLKSEGFRTSIAIDECHLIKKHANEGIPTGQLHAIRTSLADGLGSAGPPLPTPVLDLIFGLLIGDHHRCPSPSAPGVANNLKSHLYTEHYNLGSDGTGKLNAKRSKVGHLRDFMDPPVLVIWACLH